MGIIVLSIKIQKVIKVDIFQTTYDYFLRTVFHIANPFKKTIINTKCEVHKFINIKSLKMLMNDGYIDEYNFFRTHILTINEGAVWADQDFKSSNHFYNPYEKKGLYGRSNAMNLGIDYYSNAIGLWNFGKLDESLFYLGAALHIIQDMTIPQHANIRLLDNHRQYETFVKKTYQHVKEFQVDKQVYLMDSIEDYIKFNARTAIKVYEKFKNISVNNQRYYQITKCILPLAQKTTAGAMIMFYNDINIS